MGSVYQAEQPDMNRHVAIKILHKRYLSRPDLVSRFRREARAMSHLSHPNTARVFLYGQLEDGACYFVMEYLEGTSLEDMIEKSGAIPLHRGLNVANQMAFALAAAHDKGIIHRDLKPDNIMLIRRPGRRALVKKLTSETGTEKFIVEKENEYDFVKILDFGIAKVLTPD